MDIPFTPFLIGAAVLFLLVLGGLYYRLRYRIAKPDEAYIITGRKRGHQVKNPETGEVNTDLSGQKVVLGSGMFVNPLEQAHNLSLRSRQIRLKIESVVSQNNIPLNVDGIAMVKVGGSEDYIRAAAQRFLGQQDAIEDFATEVLNGSLRAIIGTLTVEQVIRDRAALANAVREEAETSLSNQGLVIDTLQIQQVTDENNYIHNLSRPEAAEIARNAKIAEAVAAQETQEREAQTREKIALANKTLALREAEIKAETDAALAKANAAGPLAEAAQDEAVIQSQQAVAIRRAELTARELETSINKPADAERYRLETEAAGRRQAAILAAEADKAASIAEAEAKATAVKLAAEAELAQRTAQAEAVRLEGEAEAAAIAAKGQAEAEALLKKAEAQKQYGEAAKMQMIVDMLPQMASAISDPLASIKDMTIISNDGATKLTQTTTDIMTQTMAVAESLGLDVSGFLKNMQPTTNATPKQVIPAVSEPTE